MKKLLLLTLMLVAGILFSCINSTTDYEQVEQTRNNKTSEALTFCKANNMNTDYCVLIDMSIHSGKHRFYIYDFKTKAITDSALVSHGCGAQPWGQDRTKTNPVFSNTDGSHLSSLGKFKIGKRGYSNWGIHVNYKLHGLDNTNNNAFKRIIVLHSWKEVSDKAIHPNGTPEGWGCPAVSNTFMTELDKKLQQAEQPVLMWVYK